MKITLTKEMKIILLAGLQNGYIYDSDMDKIRGKETIIPDKPMSRLGYLELLKKLQAEDYDQEIIDNSIIN